MYQSFKSAQPLIFAAHGGHLDRFHCINISISQSFPFLVMQVSLIVEILHLSLTLGVGPSTSQAQYLSHAPEAISARFR
jgi:hypothetical protein